MKRIIGLAACLAVAVSMAITAAWADVPQGVESGVGQMAVSCAMDSAPGRLKETAVPRPVYSKPSHAPSGMSEAEAKEWIAQRESGGDYNAVSPSGKYYGRYQLSRDKLNGDYSPENQEAAADAYVKSRYGSWAKAQEHWRRFGWY